MALDWKLKDDVTLDMAIWQHPYALVPTIWASNNAENFDQFFGENGWNLMKAWENFSKIEEIIKYLDGQLNRNTLSEGWFSWKSYEDDADIDIFLTNNCVEAFTFRIDKRASVKSTDLSLKPISFVCEWWDLSILDMKTSKFLSIDTMRPNYTI